jgi:thiol-disulfide isomerase/thioredoxin
VNLSAIVCRPLLLRVADHASAAGRSLRVLAAASCLAAALAGCQAGAGVAHPRPAPEFSGTGAWFNSPPLSVAGLRGKVVLVEFWTYACINCLHVTPQLERWHARYAEQGLMIVGVHTPELDEERIPSNVEAAIERLGIEYPVVLDNSYKTWNAYRNQYWPALYLVDREGNVVYRHYGEGDYDVTEREIRRLLASP